MANPVSSVYFISSTRLDSLDARDVEAGGQKQEAESNWLLPANLLRNIINIAYYIGLHPYKFGYSGVFTKERRIFQQVICALLHVLMVYGTFVSMMNAMPKKEEAKKHQSKYFTFVLKAAGFVFAVLFLKAFWIESEKWLKILQTLQENRSLPEIHILTKKPWIVSVFSLLLIAKLVYFLLNGYMIVVPHSNLSTSTLFRRSVVIGQHLFMFTPVQNNSVIPDWDNITVLDGSLSVFTLFYYSAAYSIYEILRMVTLTCALILWLECCTLAANVEALENGDTTWSQVFQQFEAIQKLSTVVNSALQSKVLWYMITYLAGFSFNLNTLMVAEVSLSKLNLLCSFSTVVAFLYFAADIRKKIGSLYAWTQRNGNAEQVTKQQKRAIKFERDTKGIGIHAGKYFVITFGIIYAFVGLTITFFLICSTDN